SNKKNILEQTGKRAYALIKGQCSPALVTKLEGTPGYENAEKNQNVCELLELIRAICCQFDINTQGTHALTQAKRRVYVFLQREMPNNAYLKEFQGRVKTVETYGGTFGEEPGLLKIEIKDALDPDNPTAKEYAKAVKRVSNAVQASLFISGADPKRYTKLKNALKEEYARGYDNYPTTLSQALNIQVTNESYLSNVETSKSGLLAYCNSGTTTMHKFGFMGKLKVWVNPNGLANILSFEEVEQLYPIEYGTKSTKGCFFVYTDHGKIIFEKNAIGLPYTSITEASNALCLINTVRGNFDGYTKKEVIQAKKAREALAKVGHPTEREFGELVRHNMITNCPINHQDITNANKIFGPDLPGLRGKTTRVKPMPVRTDYVAVPRYLLAKNKEVCLTADIMYVDGTPFLVTASRGIKFITIEHSPTQTTSQLKQSLIRIMQLYGRTGFKIQTILVDGQFNPLAKHLPNVVVNTTANSEHVGDIERCLRVIKERARAILSGLPYRRLPKPILIELLAFVVMWLNAFPSKSEK
ncbi:hypothetical protein ACHAXS_009567, partial [Conticribra weissflogii]